MKTEQSRLWHLLTERQRHAQDIVARMPLFTRVLLRIFARRLNRDVFFPIVARAHERGVIQSYQLHEILADFDPTQKSVVGFVTERRV